MAETISEDHCLKEWAPLSDLFNTLPSRVQTGFFSQDVKLTCVDALPEFIALGTNVGIVYWYDRKKKDMQRLRCEITSSPITVVKVISTVDFMVACGNENGIISIFQVPKSHPDSLPESLKPKNKQVERYSVSELHGGAITALEWSKNGMKLFSGDKNGLVVLTEIDFYMHLCKSYEVLNEAYEIVQLSYCQQNVLVSTLFRSIISQKQDKWKVAQIGKQDRKALGKFGGVFYQNSLRPSDTLIYCTRPGLRIWESNIQGIVNHTLLYKDLLKAEPPEVPLINPISDMLKKMKPQKEATFGVLLPFNKDFLVTFSSDVVYVLDPKGTTIIATCSNVRRVLSVATCKDELFILEGERSLIRISNRPEQHNNISPTIPTANTFTPISSSIKEITNKIHTSTIVSAIPPFIENVVSNGLNIHTDSTSVVNAEEAIESPVKHSNTPLANDLSAKNIPIDELQRKLEIYNKIGEQEYDDTILFKHSRRKKPQVDMTTSISSQSSNSSSEEKGCNITRPTVMNLSSVGVLPDLRSPDTIMKEIEQKETLLADILNFDKVGIKLQKTKTEEKPDTNVNSENDNLNSQGDCATNYSHDPKLKEAESSKKLTSDDESCDNNLASKNTGASGSSSDIRVLAQAYPYFCENSPNGYRSNLVSSSVSNTSVVNKSELNSSVLKNSVSNSSVTNSSTASSSVKYANNLISNSSSSKLNGSLSTTTSKTGKILSKRSRPPTVDIPAAVSIPLEWKIPPAVLKTRKDSDKSLDDDWEFV